MAKKSSNRFIMILRIFWEGIIIYCRNIDKFLLYMFFPVFGMLTGLFLIFTANYFYVINVPSMIRTFPVLDNIPLIFTISLICVFPGFLIFCKAFYDYIIALTALNSMVYVSRGEKIKNKQLDTKAHENILKKRTGKYLLLLLMFSILSLIGINPLLLIIYGVLCIYFILIFQVFMLEESVSPLGAFKRSFHLVKGNFLITSVLLSVSGLVTYLFLPAMFVWIVEKINIMPFLIYPVQQYINILPIEELINNFAQYTTTALSNNLLLSGVDSSSMATGIKAMVNSEVIGKFIIELTVTCIVIGMALPLRAAWFTLLYKIYDTEKTDELRKANSKKG